MAELTRILLAEHDDIEAFFTQCELYKLRFPFALKRVLTRYEFLTELESFAPNLVISDEAFGDLRALAESRRWKVLPFVIVTQDTVPLDGQPDNQIWTVSRKQMGRLTSCVTAALAGENPGFVDEGLPGSRRSVEDELAIFRRKNRKPQLD